MTVYDAAIDYARNGDAVDLYGHESFLRGAAWQKEQDATELAAIREKARQMVAESEELRWPLEKVYMSTDPPTLWQRQREFIRELAGEDNG